MSDWLYDSDDVFTKYIIRPTVRLLGTQILKTIVWYSSKSDVFNSKTRVKLAINAEGMGLENWKTLVIGGTITSGAGLSFFSFFGMAIDIVAIVDAWIRASLGIGGFAAKKYGYNYSCLEKEDFIDVLAAWVGEYDFIGNDEAKQVILSSEISKLLSEKVMLKIEAKIAAKVMVKALEKLSVKLAAKLSSLVPLAGSGANAAINAWFMDGICKAAEEAYEIKFKRMREIDGYAPPRAYVPEVWFLDIVYLRVQA